MARNANSNFTLWDFNQVRAFVFIRTFTYRLVKYILDEELNFFLFCFMANLTIWRSRRKVWCIRAFVRAVCQCWNCVFLHSRVETHLLCWFYFWDWIPLPRNSVVGWIPQAWMGCRSSYFAVAVCIGALGQFNHRQRNSGTIFEHSADSHLQCIIQNCLYGYILYTIDAGCLMHVASSRMYCKKEGGEILS